MKRFVLVVSAALLLLSCSKQPRGEAQQAESDNSILEEFVLALMEQGEIVFRDSSYLGASMDGAILDLHFSKDSKLMAYTWGNGFSYYHGTYSFPGNNQVAVLLEDQVWPELMLVKEDGQFLIHRKDGLRSLTKHILFTEKDGTQTLINDGDIYPEAESEMFPFFQKTDKP